MREPRAVTGPRWDPVAGSGLSPDDKELIYVIAQEIRDSGHPHGTSCPRHLDSAAPACECQWERGSVSMARNILKAIVRHMNPGEVL